MSKTRIYAVHDAGLDKTHLVRAKTPAAAVPIIATLIMAGGFLFARGGAT